MHRIRQIDQNCAKNCGIWGNDNNESIIKSKNLFDVKSILKSIQRFARYRIGALIWIGKLCMALSTWLREAWEYHDSWCNRKLRPTGEIFWAKISGFSHPFLRSCGRPLYLYGKIFVQEPGSSWNSPVVWLFGERHRILAMIATGWTKVQGVATDSNFKFLCSVLWQIDYSSVGGYS